MIRKILVEWLRDVAISYRPNISRDELQKIEVGGDTNLYTWEEAKIEISKIENIFTGK